MQQLRSKEGEREGGEREKGRGRLTFFGVTSTSSANPSSSANALFCCVKKSPTAFSDSEFFCFFRETGVLNSSLTDLVSERVGAGGSAAGG